MGFVRCSSSCWVHDMLSNEVILNDFDKLLTTSISRFYILRPISVVIEITNNDSISLMSTAEISIKLFTALSFLSVLLGLLYVVANTKGVFDLPNRFKTSLGFYGFAQSIC